MFSKLILPLNIITSTANIEDWENIDLSRIHYGKCILKMFKNMAFQYNNTRQHEEIYI